MMTVNQILVNKSRTVWRIHPETQLRDALRLTLEKSTDAVLVVEDEKLVGIFTQRD